MRVGDKVVNTRTGQSGVIVKIHKAMGKLTTTGDHQDAYTVQVGDVWKVFLEKSDYVRIEGQHIDYFG